RSNHPPLAQRLQRRALAMSDLQRELGTLARCPTEEPRTTVSATAVVNEVLDTLAARCAREEVQIELEAPDECALKTYPQVFKLMMRSLVEHAVLATPRGGAVKIALHSTPAQVNVHVVDAGPNVPISARRQL